MMDTDSYNGENSDFEDDVIEIDFEEQFVVEEKKRLERIDSEIGAFGVEAEAEEEEQVEMDIPKEFQEEVAVAFPEEPVTQADIYDEIAETKEPYQDGLIAEDVAVPEEDMFNEAQYTAEVDEPLMDSRNASILSSKSSVAENAIKGDKILQADC